MGSWKPQQTTGNLKVGDKVLVSVYDKARDRDDQEAMTIRAIYKHIDTGAVKLRCDDDDGVVQSVDPAKVIRKI